MSAPYTTQLLNTPSVHSKTVIHRIYSTWSYVTEGLVNVTWRPLSRVARDNILSLLQRIEVGQLKIITPQQTWTFGCPCEQGLEATLHVKSDAFWKRVAFFTDLGLAEAYMNGDVDCDDMSSLLKILILNRGRFGNVTGLTNALSYICGILTLSSFDGDLSNSRANISSHYDLGNTMYVGVVSPCMTGGRADFDLHPPSRFSAFLSEDMNYSSAIFKDYNEDLKPDGKVIESLEDAQMRKMRTILKKVRIRPGDRVLEIVGTGWGSLAILAASTVECTIDTVTLSVHQANMARKRIEEAGLSDRVKVYNMDFRECMNKPEWKGAFDRFISIEMIENVGKDYQDDFWRVADWALKKDTAIGFVQVISLPEARVRQYDQNADFVQKWVIFPGCYIPSLHFIIDSMYKGSEGRLTVDSVYNIGPHYARTLREWKRKFCANWEPVIAKALKHEYDLCPEELEVFRRKWMCDDYCEVGFATRTLGDHCITFTRDGHIDFGCDLEI
ncbi:hypothetical protein AMATHDRAFT_153349 [Amanita thiersii Skay4041]|uniref:CFS1-like protein n=1 Tax=Amanita thiersii Skay4041 TaxID=703135 RepID=A0A2A9NC89_9AGAR|nr:hypothetical protein AMATHDRAFT_153349 [Amanita thiersii Skay4041]